MIADVWDVGDGELVRCYWIGIGEMEMYRMMELLNPRNFLQSRSPRCRSDQPEVPRLEAAFFYHLLDMLTYYYTICPKPPHFFFSQSILLLPVAI